MSSQSVQGAPQQPGQHTLVTGVGPVASTSSASACPDGASSSSHSDVVSSSRPVLQHGSKKPLKLNAVGIVILEDYLQKNNNNYSVPQRQAIELAAEIKSKTGYEGMTADKVQLWMARRKKQVRIRLETSRLTSTTTSNVAESPLQGASASTKLPSSSFHKWVPAKGPLAKSSLSPVQIKLLEASVGDQAVTDELITLWAEGLSVDRTLVEEHLRNKCRRSQGPELPPTPISPTMSLRDAWFGSIKAVPEHRLPTPADSVSSAQNVSSPLQSLKGDTFDNVDTDETNISPSPPYRSFPALLDRSPSIFCSPRVDTATLPTTTMPPPPPKIAESLDPTTKAIIEGIQQALHTPHTCPMRPKDKAQFNALWTSFAPVRERLQESLRR